ncbi:malonyl CoA-acyl carrier protein transacylase [Mycobacterium kansasii]|uniref:Malonyl CoA-acyl carrier protein transacylase n=1 Tax=Mycobacterium kansasii TaxID=1768 RepID=A0A1V3WYS3_MYCKA|nr:malonyl CoA-acyl carrier protein transacylase [Mycobacterium kansasii]
MLGGDEAEVLSRLEQLDLVPANRNAAGQIVAAGRLTALEKLTEDPPAKARVRALGVAGAFHTQFMARPWRATPPRRRASRPPSPPLRCCPTATESPSLPRLWRCRPWSPSSLSRCAGTCAPPICVTTQRAQSRRSWSSPRGHPHRHRQTRTSGVPTRAVKSPADLDELASL